MRTLNIRHPAMRGLAEALLDLFPNGADVSEIGPEREPCLFVNWRTSGSASHPGNVGWGVHYRFEPQAFALLDESSESARQNVWERVRELSRALQFDYADPDAVSLLVVDINTEACAGAIHENLGLDRVHAPRVT
jgi:hypothetical protein